MMIYIINLILGICFILLDLFNYDSNFIKWLTSFNNFIYLLVTKTNSLATYSTFLVCLADCFLLFTNHYLIGISLFIFIQLTYMKILNTKTYFPFIFLIIFMFNPLISLALIYLSYSLFNLAYSFNHDKLLFISLSLLLCCDILIALTYLNLINSSFRIFIWTFYLPSQLCFVYSQSFIKKWFINIYFYVIIT